MRLHIWDCFEIKSYAKNVLPSRPYGDSRTQFKWRPSVGSVGTLVAALVVEERIREILSIFFSRREL